jgi:hypothetical protein
MWFLRDCLIPTQLLSQSEAFTGMTALRGSSISMEFRSYLKNLTPLCENKPEMISLARIRLRYRKQNPAYAGCSPIWAALVGGFSVGRFYPSPTTVIATSFNARELYRANHVDEHNELMATNTEVGER